MGVARRFADGLERWVALTEAERGALARLEERPRPVRRGTVLVRENDVAGELFLLQRGLAMSYVVLDDGSRQILRFQYPGDLMGTPTLAYARSPETLVALGDGVVCAIERAAFAALLTEHPRLSAIFLALHQADRAALTDRLAALGRTSARGRIAGLLVELAQRLRGTGLAAADGSFVAGLTQEEMGDATGLTAVHVNRMLRVLEEEGLLARRVGRFRLLDEPALARAANYVDRFSGIDLNWLTPARP